MLMTLAMLNNKSCVVTSIKSNPLLTEWRWTSAAYFSSVVTFICGIVRGNLESCCNNSRQSSCIASYFGVEHDECYDTLVQTMIKFGISLPAINNSSRHGVVVQCILFGFEHDEPPVPSDVRITLEAPQSQFFDQGASGKEHSSPMEGNNWCSR